MCTDKIKYILYILTAVRSTIKSLQTKQQQQQKKILKKIHKIDRNNRVFLHTIILDKKLFAHVYSHLHRKTINRFK